MKNNYNSPNKILLFSYFFCINLSLSFSITFGVNTTNDSQDISLGDGLCQDAVGNCSLRAAIQEANALAGADQINLPSGTYLLTIVGNNEDACATGDLDITSEINIVGADAWTTIIDGNRLDRVFHVSAAGFLGVSQATIRKGFLSTGFGAGFLNEGNLSISYCTIDTNVCLLSQGASTSGGFGGAIANLRTLIVSNTTIQYNVAQGAIGNDAKNGGAGGGSSPGFGGAIYNENTGIATLTNCTIYGNRALGGKSSRGATNGGNFSAAGFAGAGPSPGTGGAAGGGTGGNGAAFAGGGGGGSSCSIAGIGGNGGYGAGGGGRGARSCGGGGGAVGIAGFGGGDGDGSCCSSCGGGGAGAGFGGGVFNNGGTVTIIASTIAFNEALGGFGRTGQGGYAARGLAGMGLGGGLFNRSGNMSINNTIISNNLADTLNNVDVSNGSDQGDLFGTFTSADGHNLVMTPAAAVLGGNTANNLLNQDPSLLALANNGGANNTLELDACVPSVAIDVGFASAALDQRDLVQVNGRDIGSFEQQSTCVLLSAKRLQFRGEKQKQSNVLEWNTETEVNSDVFELYRSVDGLSWELLASKEGAPNASSPQSYSVIDAAPFSSVTYYRLKWLFNDETHSYSNIISITRKNQLEDGLRIYPNPFKNSFTISLWSRTTQPIKVTIFDNTGSLVYEQSLEVRTNEVELSIGSELVPGVYVVKVDVDGTRYVRKAIKVSP